MEVAIIDYGMGNVASVQKALSSLHVNSCITKDLTEIEKAKYIILPGVGSFHKGISNLKEFGLYDFLTKQVIDNKKPFLGICLGMQLIASIGTEPFEVEGLNWINGRVIKFELPNKRIPHLGWNDIVVKDHKYFSDIVSKDFYFIHSYHFDVTDKKYVSSIVDYGFEVVSSVQKDNIFATQFHPEKSQESGLKVIKNFIEINA